MKTLCSFAVELTAENMDPDRIEDVVYNCLDFCQMNERKPHFCIFTEAGVPGVWSMIELLHGEAVGFSLLTEPECSRVGGACSIPGTIRIDGAGNAYYGDRNIGNVWEDRLADLWVTVGPAAGEEMFA